MHIIVCIKSVVTAAPRGRLVRTAENSALNPFDRPVLATALSLKERHGGSVTALSMGPPAAEETLREALAIGADRAVLLCDPALAGGDTLATAAALGAGAAFLAPFDLLLFGARSSDSDTGQVGPQTAALLSLPMVTGVTAVDVTGQEVTVERKVDDFLERYALATPAALAVHPAAAAPRDAALGGLAAAFDEMPVETLDIGKLGLDAANVGDAGSPTRVLSTQQVKKDRACEWIEGSPAEQAERLVQKLAADGLIG